MVKPSQIQEAIQALSTRSALEEIEFRRQHGVSPTSLATTGVKFIPAPKTSQTSPLYDENGHLFASSIIGRADTGVNLPQNTGPGTIVLYQNDQNQTKFALVKKKTKKGIKVKNLSTQDLTQHLSRHPSTQIITTNETNLKKIPSRSTFLSKLFDTLDPTESIFFKIVIKILMGNLNQIESVWEVFIILYLRLLILAGIIIALVYVITSLI